VLLTIAPGLALSAEYRILPNGTGYQGSVQVQGADRYQFAEVDMLGEMVPIQVTGVSLSGACFPCCFTWQDRSTISFSKGNYTVHYTGSIRENHLVTTYSEPYMVTMIVPPGLDVRNRLLGMISPGGVVSVGRDGSVIVTWNETRSAELRFYSPDREQLLVWFGQFWIIIAIVLLLPFLLMRKRKE
jgi:hypothetical protein